MTLRITEMGMKAAVASYWRYVRQCPFVALEASSRLQAFNDGGQSDVLVLNQHRLLIETEVKLDIAGFRRDRKKLKHRCLADNDGSYPVTYFYFAVPKSIANKVAFLCAELYPYAGVLSSDGGDGYDVEVYREPKIRLAKPLSFLELTRLAREQSATLCRLAQEVAQLRYKKEIGKADE